LGESLVGEDGQEFDQWIEDTIPPEMADEAKTEFRKDVGDTIAEIYERIEAGQQEIAANAMACSGVLRMRATKDHVTYIVNLCTSPRVHVLGREKPMHISLHVSANPAKE
jgi:hypothetical protein